MWKESPPFSFSAGERKIMAHFVVKEKNGLIPGYPHKSLKSHQVIPEPSFISPNSNPLASRKRSHS